MEVPHSMSSSSPSSSSASGHTSGHLSFKKKISKSVNSATLRLQLKGISLSEAKSATKSAIRSSKYRIKEKSMDIWSRSKVPLRRGRKKSKELFETVRSSDLVTSLSSRVHKLAVVTQTHTKRLTGQSKEGDANDLTDEDEDDEYIFDSEFSFSSSEDEEHEGQVNGKSYDPCTGFYGMDREGNANYEPETTDDDGDEEEDEDSVDKDSYLASNKLPQVECTSIRKLDEDHHLYYNKQANNVYSNTSDVDGCNKSNRNNNNYNSININNGSGLSNVKCVPKHCETSNYSNNNNCDVKSNNNYSAATTEGREDRRPHLLSTSCTKLTSTKATNKGNTATTSTSSLTPTTLTTPASSIGSGDATNCKSSLNHQELFHQQLTERLQLQRNKLQKCLNEKSESSNSLGQVSKNNEFDHGKCTLSSLRVENNNKSSLYENVEGAQSNSSERSNLLYNSCIELRDGKGDGGNTGRNNKEKTLSSTHDLMHVSSIQPSGKLLNNEESRNNNITSISCTQEQQQQQQLNFTSSTSHSARTSYNSSKVEIDEVMKCRENSVKVTCEKNEKPLKPPKPPGLSSLPSLVNTVIAKNTLRRKTQRPNVQPPPPPPPPPPFNSLNCLTIEPPAEFSEGSTSEDKNEKKEGERAKEKRQVEPLQEVKVSHKEEGKGREGKLLGGAISSNNESMSQLNGKTKARQDLPALPPLPPPNNRPSVLHYAQRMLLKDGPSDETEANTLIPEARKAACVSSSSPSPPLASSSFFSAPSSTASSHSCSSSSASTSSSSSSSSSSASTQYQVSYGDEDDKEGDEEDGDEASYEVPADSCPWFRPDLTRIEAEKFLLSSSLPDGSFVIRPGGSILYPYSLTLLSDGRTYHLNVRKVPGFDAYSLGKGSNGRSFDSLKSLVEYYSDKPLLLVSNKNHANSPTTTTATIAPGGGGNCITGGFNNTNHSNNYNSNSSNNSSGNISNGNTGKKVNNPSEFSTSRKYVRLLLLK